MSKKTLSISEKVKNSRTKENQKGELRNIESTINAGKHRFINGEIEKKK
jgi:hypothetical protein